MLCPLRVELELSIQAKAVLIARDAGVSMPAHPDARAVVDEIRYLRGSIGPTGLIAIGPVHVTSHRDDRHRYLLTGRDSPFSACFARCAEPRSCRPGSARAIEPVTQGLTLST